MKDTSESAWRKTLEHARQVHDELVAAVAAFPDSRLGQKVPGKDPDYHTFYYNLHGVVQHELLPRRPDRTAQEDALIHHRLYDSSRSARPHSSGAMTFPSSHPPPKLREYAVYRTGASI